jgi:hypothetical protein
MIDYTTNRDNKLISGSLKKSNPFYEYCIFFHKFKIKKELYLLAYRYNNDTFELIMIGPHENYYRTLGKSLN